MYHSVIGKRLVECVNKRDGRNYTVRGFYDKVYVPLFFANERLLQYVNNSPFDQVFGKQKVPFSVAVRDECLRAVHEKVDNLQPDASFFLGGPAAGSAETTSGQVTDLHIPIHHEDIYASWIGAAAGLTVDGGMTILLDSEDVLLTTYDGWMEYRRFVDQTPKIKALQINAWNGQWVASKMRDLPFLTPIVDKDGNALKTQKWVELLFALSYHNREGPRNSLLGYVYSLGQSNTTLGFIRLNLSDARRLVDIYRQFFTVPPGMQPAAFESLYQTDQSFRVACSYTEVGLRALRPKDVFGAQKGVPKLPDAKDPIKRLDFDIYQTWIIAMLNNMELIPRAEELASALCAFRQRDERGKTVHEQMVIELLGHRRRREFIDGLTAILDKDGSHHELFDRIANDITTMSPDNVPLFLTLVRFKYSAINAKK